MDSKAIPLLNLPTLPQGRFYRFHTMVKPTGALCNLDCPYCFYLHKSDLLGHEKNARMSDSLLEQHIRQYIEAQTGDEVVFSWQGGEPTIMGIEFFERVVALQNKYRKSWQRIENDLQTNGLLIDQDWARFLKSNNFHVGLSLDGPQDLHDKYRPTKGGTPTFYKVIEAANILANAEVSFALLCVVNRDVALAPKQVWETLRAIPGNYRIQFTPCVEPTSFKTMSPNKIPISLLPTLGSERTRPDHPLSIVTSWSVDARDYGNFLCAVWSQWLNEDFGRIHVNVFESAISQALGLPAHMCTSSPVCGKALALEHDGNLYSCDHFVYPDYQLGNIFETHQGDLAFSRQQIDFGLSKSSSLPEYCKRCDQLSLCWGECPKNRLIKTPTGESGLNYLCEGLKHFYSQVQSDISDIRKRLGLTAA